MIHDAQLDYYGKRLATCSSDKSIKIFDATSKNSSSKLADLIGHDGPVWQIAWAHPKFGSLLASCSYDRMVIIWKEERPYSNVWYKVYEYKAHELSVNTVAWAPYELGLMLACGSSDGYISILTLKDSEWQKTRFLAHQLGVNAVSWAPAAVPSSLLAPSPLQDPTHVYRARLVSGGCDNLVKIWHNHAQNEWKKEDEEGSHSDWVRDVAWAPNVGLPYSTIASCSQDGTVIIWSQTDNNSKWNKTALPIGDRSVIWRVSWSITGNILAVSSGDNSVTLWKESPDGWKCISQIDEHSSNKQE
eukprot:TRINITY_DN4519_c0_g1_i1.p1 TRINITY_DN4519_c0_g1~~TRINITY_DN4519_c0_g1_i1.p1  ORF type:complete len:302 (-),score=43.14 TRINITY_DN4519_c0_g1_i1:103-1008(-)